MQMFRQSKKNKMIPEAICYTTVLLKAIAVSNKFSPETVFKKHGVKHGRK